MLNSLAVLCHIGNQEGAFPWRLGDRSVVPNLPHPGNTGWDSLARSHFSSWLQTIFSQVGSARVIQSGPSSRWRWERAAWGETSFLKTYFFPLSFPVENLFHNWLIAFLLCCDRKCWNMTQTKGCRQKTPSCTGSSATSPWQFLTWDSESSKTSHFI